MSLDLNLTLSCENYWTGTSSNVSYAEEREIDIVEQHAPEGSGCQRIFYCNWDDRSLFVHNLLGFAKVATWPSGDAGGEWNKRYVHRVLPQGYHMGWKDESSVYSNWVYATRATVQPYGEKRKNVATYDTPDAEYARVTVQYAALDYSLFSDATIRYASSGTDGNLGVATMAEWKRYCRIVQKPATQFFQYPQQALKLVDWPTAGQSKGINFYPSVLDNIADFLVYIKDLPYDPIAGLFECFGKLNKFSMFETPDNPNGQPAESLHLVAADITRLPMRMGVKYWDLMLGFRKNYNRDQDGLQVGHNYVRDLITVSGVQKLRLFRVSSDGTNSLTAGNPMIDVEDFRKIFWIPDSIP